MQRDQLSRDLTKCLDMRSYAQKARTFLGDSSLDRFMADEMMQSAIIRSVEIVGEAARLVSEETRARAPKVEWFRIVGMRHILAHNYGAVDLETVYEVVSHQLEPLIAELTPLIKALESETGSAGEG